MGLFGGNNKRKPAKRKSSVNTKIRKVNRGLRGFNRLLNGLSKLNKPHHVKGAPRGMKY